MEYKRIASKQDLKEFLLMDKEALRIKKKYPSLMGDEIWKFQIILRKHEYYLNCTNNLLLQKVYSYFHKRMGMKLGYLVPCNVFGGG